MEKRQIAGADVIAERRQAALDAIAQMHTTVGPHFLRLHMARLVAIIVDLFGEYGSDRAVVCDLIEQVARQQARQLRQEQARAARDA